MTDIRACIWEKIAGFVENDPGNALAAHGSMRIYDSPLIEAAQAGDPYFEEFRRPGVVGPDFMPPGEWLPGAKSVICYFLPFTKEIRDSNRGPYWPSGEWVSARIDGEAFNNALRTFLVSMLTELGAQAVAPVLDPRFKVRERISNWSERHAAFAAGLGTFGLHRALITKKGTAGRLGSVITSLALEPTPRGYACYDAYCPYLTKGQCGACIPKCPPAAISGAGKDNRICSDFLDNEILPKFAPRYGCAKCNISVPCEHALPMT